MCGKRRREEGKRWEMMGGGDEGGGISVLRNRTYGYTARWIEMIENAPFAMHARSLAKSQQANTPPPPNPHNVPLQKNSNTSHDPHSDPCHLRHASFLRRGSFAGT